MLPTLFDASRRHGVGFGDSAQALHHFGQLGWIKGLHCELHRGFATRLRKFKRGKNVDFAIAVVASKITRSGADNCRRFDNIRIDASEKNPVSGPGHHHLRAGPSARNPHVGNCRERHVFVIVRRVRLAEDFHSIPRFHGTRVDSSERGKRLAVGLRVELGHVDDERAVRIAFNHRSHGARRERSRIAASHLPFGRSRGRWYVMHDGVHEPRARSEVLPKRRPHQRTRRRAQLFLPQQHPKAAERPLHVPLRLPHAQRVHLVQRLENELDERPPGRRPRNRIGGAVPGAALERPGLGVEVGVPPQPLGERLRGQVPAEAVAAIEGAEGVLLLLLRVEIQLVEVLRREALERERVAVHGGREYHVAPVGGEAGVPPVRLVAHHGVDRVDQVAQFVIHVVGGQF
mmetsp:Transcript_13713/g.29801  ORF Transcript_13713/g.29801 Transcript_13713/m.29801 type:complete len:402 (-) Transcript_13713:527-1732(-)